jgi:hypothetical protein
MVTWPCVATYGESATLLPLHVLIRALALKIARLLDTCRSKHRADQSELREYGMSTSETLIRLAISHPHVEHLGLQLARTPARMNFKLHA